MYNSLKPGDELDSLLTKRIIERRKPANFRRILHPGSGTRYSTNLLANHELINSVLDLGFEFRIVTRRIGEYCAVFIRDDQKFEGYSTESQLMANCLAALAVADYLDQNHRVPIVA